MKAFLLGIFSLVSLVVTAQTKKIAFKSHSGSDENFSIALEGNLFDMGNSNFGLPSDIDKWPSHLKPGTTELDSVIFIKDSVAVLVSHKKISVTDQRISKKDTLHGRALFSRKISVDSIRKGLIKEIYFTNSVDSVKFIGFDKKKKRKNNSLPVMGTSGQNTNGPFDSQALLIIGLIIFFSLAAGLFTWKYSPVRQG
ncbi:MAG: hypothetical protein JNM19_05660 [Chitinophagaceae bacterium]|nr:hypothetical protein [Chitinophagaceae bacterium]